MNQMQGRCHDRGRMHLAMSATIVVMLAGALIGGHPAAASALGSAASGSGAAFCTPHNGLSTSGASLNGVYPCADPNIDDQFGYQCVEYSVRFDAVVYGTNPSWASGGSGKNVVNSLRSHGIAASSPNGTAAGSTSGSQLPVAGDVISMWGSGQDALGHTGVVSKVTARPGTGNYTITYLDENGRLSDGNSVGDETVAVNDWVWQPAFPNSPYRYNVYNWTTQGAEQLWDYTQATGAKGPIAKMLPGTSPSITALPNGGWESAYQGSDGKLYEYSSATGKVTAVNGSMKAGTSPSIAALPNGGWVIAYQGASGTLWDYSSTGTSKGPLGNMMAGTSPSITALPNGGWEIAYQGASGTLWEYSSTGTSKGPLANMMAGTSPSITALTSTTWEIAYQSASGTLWEYSSTGTSKGSLGNMMAGTSPSITALTGNSWEIAYQGASGTLWEYSSSGTSKGPIGNMMAGTSPSISATSGTAWVIAYHGAAGNMWEYASSGTSANSGTSIAAGTSPAIAALTNGRDQVAIARS